MPTYALLGATGATGSAILRCLLLQPPPDLELNIFVRSKSKLFDAFPDLERTTVLKTNIIEGVPSDTTAVEACLKDVDVVMACIGTNISTAGISIVHDTTTAIVKALEAHQKSQGPAYKTPTIIQLRSASLNPVFEAALPWIARNMAAFCFYYIYEDLDRACELFVSSAEQQPQLLDYIFMDPPSIHDADGTTPTGYKLILDGKQETALNYADLGVAFCEVAERRTEFSKMGVGITSTGPVNMTLGTMFSNIAMGAKGRIWG